MNVFMILIMAAMLGIYQYFTAKKSSDVTLNKEELAFEAELNCLKQFHDYGAAKNEATLQEGLLNPGYTCAGSENIKLAKYFIKNDQTISEHCVATTSSKEKLDNSLKALLFKKGIEEIKNGSTGPTIKGIKISSLNHTASTSTTTSFGLVSCVPAKQIEEREKMAGEDCAKKGKFATRTPSGEFICTDVPEVTGCTAHEEERPASGINCTGVGNEKYCCPKNPSNICGNDTNIKAVWNTSSRFYNCVNGEETCNKGSKSMQVVDENNIKGKYSNTASVDKFYIAKYNTTNRQWDCIPNAELLIKTCKEAVAKNNLAYVSVTDISKANATPVCQGASSKSASAVETCSACGIPTLDKDQWKCEYPEIIDNGRKIGKLPNGISWPTYISKVSNNAKGISACFQGCNGTTTSGTKYIDEITAGNYNGINWGLAWNSNSKLFECFQCGERTSAGGTLTYAQSYINSNCKENPNADSQTTSSCNAENNLHKDTDCKNRTTYINGKCVLRCCNELYRKRGTDGKCYTKWCRGIPAEANATTGKPAENECPESHPRLLYHETKDCVYCIKTPPFSIVESKEESSN